MGSSTVPGAISGTVQVRFSGCSFSPPRIPSHAPGSNVSPSEAASSSAKAGFPWGFSHRKSCMRFKNCDPIHRHCLGHLAYW
jgi:hypothetical protein